MSEVKENTFVTKLPGDIHEDIISERTIIGGANVTGGLLTVPDVTKTPDELFEELLVKIRKYHPSGDLSMVEKAYRVAKEFHKDQKRKSGEPYIIHPVCVAIILAELELDKETIEAGLLHDVLEDTSYTYEEMEKEFGPEVVTLVDGVTKLTNITFSHDKVEEQAENLRKMFLAMAKDIRVILIKLADRLHNMRTMQYQSPAKRIEKSRETMDIYAPLASRLGISKVKVELDDLSLRYLEPDIYEELSKSIANQKKGREDFISGIVAEVSSHIEAAGIKAQVGGRVKHLFSIYKKMKNQNKTLDQIYDIFAVRILVDDVRDCYAALGVIHSLYKPIPGRFKDYIAMPKPNMYQSLHTTLIGTNGQPFEIQIRTYEMHRTAEYGIAAHWKYNKVGSGQASDSSEEKKLSWLRQILEWQKDENDNSEFLSMIKTDLNLFTDSVFCFTPAGDIKTLPLGSTPIDFAYSIHSAVGNKMVGARVNGRMVNIDYNLKNGDRVEIVTSQNSKGPSRDWLKIVKTAQARNKINGWYKTELKEENILRGGEQIAAYCKLKNINLNDIKKPEYIEVILKKYSCKDWDAVLAAVGHGGLKEAQIVNRLQEEYLKDHPIVLTDEEAMEKYTAKTVNRMKVSRSGRGVEIRGTNDVAVRFPKCCSPVPGDEIVGYITRGRGLSVHRTDCINILSLSEEEKGRLIPAEWEETVENENYLTEIKIFANDRIGLLKDILNMFAEERISIHSSSTSITKGGIATINLSIKTKNKEHLQRIADKIRNVAGVIDVERS